MADKIIINNRNIGNIREGFNRYFPEGIKDENFVDGSFSSGDFRWLNRQNFIEFIANEVQVYINLKQSLDTRYKLVKEAQLKFETEATHPQSAVENTTPQNIDIEANERKEAERKKLIEESNKKVQDAIDRKVAIHNQAAKLKSSYVKTEYTKPSPNADSEAFGEAAKSAAQFHPILKEQIKESLKASVEGISDEDADFLANKTAFTLIDATNSPDEYIKNAQNVAVLEQISVNPAYPVDVREAAADDAALLKEQTNYARLITAAINPKLAGLIPASEDVSVSFSTRRVEGFREFSPVRLVDGYQDLLSNQLLIFNSFKDIPLHLVRERLMGRANQWVEGQIAQRFPKLIGVFDSKTANVLLSGLGFGKLTLELPAAFTGAVTKTPELLNLMNFGGSFMGVSFKTAAPALAKGGQIVGSATAKAVIATQATEATSLAIGGALAPETLGLSLVAMVGQIVVQKVIKTVTKFAKDNIPKYSKAIVIGIGVLAGAGISLVSSGLSSVVFGGIVGGFTGYALNTFAGGGLSGIRSGLAGFGSGVLTFFDTLWAAFLAGIGGPILAFLIGFPILVIFILFIINSGAYVVPPGESQISSTNPYISVTKTANPGGQLPSPTTVTYTITIAAKMDTLTGISIETECHAQTQSGTLTCPTEDIPTPDKIPAQINTGAPFTFTFTSAYGNIFQDSLVSNNITVKATSASGGPVTETGSASVCFGKCPLDCFKFPEQYWPNNSDVQKLKSLLTGAVATLVGLHPDFTAKVCAGKGDRATVNLCYRPDQVDALGPAIFAYDEDRKGNSICDTDFNTRVNPSGPTGALFLLTHEETHHIQDISGQYLRQFEDQVSPVEPSVCSYGGSNPFESMAEGAALYVAKPTLDKNGGCITNFQTQYPKHYNYDKNVLFAK